MLLSEITIQGVRNLKSQCISLSPKINVLVGQNGSGKTSFLESIYVLGTGRSFRTSKVSNIITHGQDESIIHGKIYSNKDGFERIDSLGISRRKSSFTLRLNSKTEKKQSELAKLFPILFITPQSHQLLESGPQWRRRYIDWTVFHVEHSYSSTWSQYNRVLKHRNSLLHNYASCNKKEFELWNSQFISLADAVTQQRKNVFSMLKPYLIENLAIFFPERDIAIDYFQGYLSDNDVELRAELERSLMRDISRRRTELGPHRAELKIQFNGTDAKDYVSRGQQKLFVYALVLAQAKLLQAAGGVSPLLLLDDLAAELDNDFVNLLLEELSSRFEQLIITSAKIEDVPKRLSQHAKMFHVEHGMINNFINTGYPDDRSSK